MLATGSVDTEHPQPMMPILVGFSNTWRWKAFRAAFLLHCGRSDIYGMQKKKHKHHVSMTWNLYWGVVDKIYNHDRHTCTSNVQVILLIERAQEKCSDVSTIVPLLCCTLVSTIFFQYIASFQMILCMQHQLKLLGTAETSSQQQIEFCQ